MPTSGKATYNGRAFNAVATNDADFRYTINFGSRKGSGEISAAGNHGRLTLNEAPITLHNAYSDYAPVYGVEHGYIAIDGKNTINSYDLVIAGPQAEEIVGDTFLDNDDQDLVFYGSRGAISQ